MKTHTNSLNLFPYLNDLKNNNEFLFEEKNIQTFVRFFQGKYNI